MPFITTGTANPSPSLPLSNIDVQRSDRSSLYAAFFPCVDATFSACKNTRARASHKGLKIEGIWVARSPQVFPDDRTYRLDMACSHSLLLLVPQSLFASPTDSNASSTNSSASSTDCSASSTDYSASSTDCSASSTDCSASSTDPLC
ncbi:hypothetical protein FHG87_004133 [Trinorchestia longiramus]|nr:hypothetical protein FHG87_004133 [Trinorchestia longiramus]